MKLIRVVSWSVTAALLLLFLALNGSRVQSLPALVATNSRWATPLPSPVNNGGKATWSVTQTALISNYPQGFDFTIVAKSSAGKITKAVVSWRHSTRSPSLVLATAKGTDQFIAHWKPLVGQNIPQWVGIDYWWTLTDDKGNTFETPHAYTEYADTTRKWNRLVAEDAVIHWEASLPADLGQQIAAALKQQRALYLQGWGKLLDYKPHVIIYASHQPWQEWDPEIDTEHAKHPSVSTRSGVPPDKKWTPD